MNHSDDGQLRGNQLSIDGNYIGSDIMTDIINSMVCQSEPSMSGTSTNRNNLASTRLGVYERELGS
jgi:hypothetical protein